MEGENVVMRKYCDGTAYEWTADARTIGVKAEDLTDEPPNRHVGYKPTSDTAEKERKAWEDWNTCCDEENFMVDPRCDLT